MVGYWELNDVVTGDDIDATKQAGSSTFGTQHVNYTSNNAHVILFVTIFILC